MYEQTQTTEETKAANADKPEFLLTTTGVMILGAELIGNKMTALLCEAFKLLEADGVAMAEFRADNWPKEAGEPVFGMAYADTHSFSVNLQRCWDSAVEDAEKGEELGFLGMLWINVLQAIGHEIDHLNIAYGDRDLYEGMRAEPDLAKDLETAADETAVDTIIRLARKFDIEPAIEDLGWFGIKIMSLMTDDDTKALEWVCKLRKQLEDGIIYDSEAGQCFTLREFIQMAHAASEEWPQKVTAVNLDEYLENDVVITHKAEPVKEAVIETVVLASDEVPAEAVAMAAGANGMFVGAGEIATEPDVVVADNAGVVQNIDTTALANATEQDKVIQALMDGPVVVAGADTVEAQARAMAAPDTAPAVETLEVPLPAPVAEQQAVFAAAAATAVPPEAKPDLPYTPHDLSPEIQAAVMKAVWHAVYHHIFTKCDWQQNPQTGRFAFMKSAAVLEGINIQHILQQYGADNFIMEYDTLNANGQGGHSYAAEACQGMLRGRLTTGGLPSYQLYLNIGGQRIRRLFVPQNPEKRGANNAYSTSADQAGAGNQIAWIFRGEAPDGASFKEKCAVKMTNTAAGIVYEVF